MGQYYLTVILAEKSDKEYVRTYLDPGMYNNGMKLVEHSYIGNNFMKVVENVIGPNGMFYKSRLVWAGDYADNEPDSEKNLHTMCEGKVPFEYNGPLVSYSYIVNHTKKVYVKKTDGLHPLSLLTAEGNGRGSGDYDGPNMDLVGTWARDVISMENEAPDYTLIECVF
uniref:Uncharacterized protein n=1 Tax=viral metagenome TaxID=1070528 RepID=A0A6C0DLN2_9ZZZZ